MGELPSRWDGARLNRQQVRAVESQRRTELEIFEHALGARYLAECDRIDSAAIADVARTALEEEMSVLDFGLEKAAGSAAKAELVSRMVSLQSRIDSARIARRFGS